MTDIILYISIIVVSGIVGSKVRAYRDRLGWTGTVQTMAIVLLVVLMGARMGANEEIIDNLGTIGLAAFAMTIAMMIGSLLCLFFARKALGFTKDAKIAALHADYSLFCHHRHGTWLSGCQTVVRRKYRGL